MFIKTVSTTSGINPIKFDETGGVFYWILNTGLSTVYASTKSTFTAGDDGVVSLGPKESRRLETNNDTIYILGEGQVEIHNQRDGICSFKQAPTSSGGGETIDAYTKTESDAKYAAKSDVPDAYTKTESDDKYAQKTDVVPYKMGMDFATCTTPAETVVKSVTTMHKVAPALGAVFAVKFNNAVPAQARLNINGLTGYIQYRGARIPNGVINAGDIATFIYYSSSGFNTFEILSVENGGNADYAANAGNADTVDNLHADDFVNANDRDQIQIPSNVDVPVWIHTNGKRFQRYMTNAGNIGLTNVPDNSTDYVWYWYDGLNILARVNSPGKYYICDTINGNFSGWKDIYTSGNKPYVTGVVVVDSNGKANISFGFEPSFVLYEPASPKSGIFGSVYSATTFNATGFTPSADTYTGGPTGTGFSYIAFK